MEDHELEEARCNRRLAVEDSIACAVRLAASLQLDYNIGSQVVEILLRSGFACSRSMAETWDV